jgi:Transposase DDE domain
MLTAQTLRAVLRLSLRQTEGLIGSVIRLLGLDLPMPDHTTLSRQADGLDVPDPQSRPGANGMHRIVDSSSLKFHGPREWQVEKHGAKTS